MEGVGWAEGRSQLLYLRKKFQVILTIEDDSDLSKNVLRGTKIDLRLDSEMLSKRIEIIKVDQTHPVLASSKSYCKKNRAIGSVP